MVDHENGHVKQVLLDVVENARLYLESDHDRDPQLAHALHLHFAKFISSLVKSFSGKIEKRYESFISFFEIYSVLFISV